MWQPLAPAFLISFTVLATMNALPHPVSASAIRGKSHEYEIRLMSSQTSFKVVIAKSGSPSE